MAYTIHWHPTTKVIRLTIQGTYSVADAVSVNTWMIAKLEDAPQNVILILDATTMNRPYHFDQIRTAQSYIRHSKLRYIYIVTKDLLVKLALMVIFNTARAHLQFFDTPDHADNSLRLQLKL